MASVKSAKLQLQSESGQTFPLHDPLSQTNKSDDQSQNDSSEEQNQRIVSLLFPQKKIKRPYHNQLSPTQDDSDIKGFLEEQIPGLYRASTNDDIYDQSSEQESPENLTPNDADFYMNYSISSGPGYFTMSRVEKVSYFESLNSIYMARMRADSKKNTKQHFNNAESKLEQQEVNSKKDKNKKRAIRFNQIVCEVPFNKEQQPTAVKDTPEEEAFIVFDDAAYDEGFDEQEAEEERMAMELYQAKKNRDIQRTKAYIDEQGDSDSPQTMFNMERMQFLKELNEIQKYNGQGLEDEDDEHVFFTDSDDQLIDFDSDEEEWPSEDDQNSFEEDLKECFSQNQSKQCNDGLVGLNDQERKNWKRNHRRQFLQDEESSSDQSSSSGSSEESSSSDESNEQGSPQKPIQQKQTEKPREGQIEQAPEFLEGMKGRKMNQNAEIEQSKKQETEAEQISGSDQNKQSPANQPIPKPETIATENNLISEFSAKPSEQICENTSEGQPIE